MVLFGIPQEVSTLRVMHFLKNQKKDRSNLPGGHTLVSSRYCPGILSFRKVWKLELFLNIEMHEMWDEKSVKVNAVCLISVKHIKVKSRMFTPEIFLLSESFKTIFASAVTFHQTHFKKLKNGGPQCFKSFCHSRWWRLHLMLV